MLMFSINPPMTTATGSMPIGSVDERTALYRRCEAEGVGISVMKAFGGGQLLNEKTSPFQRALTEYQCIQYAPGQTGSGDCDFRGIRGREDLKRILGFLEASPEEKDYFCYRKLLHLRMQRGSASYCNHCQPCPAGLDVGLINKYYNLAQAGDVLAKGPLYEPGEGLRRTASAAGTVIQDVPSMWSR